MKAPHIIEFSKLGASNIGFISVAENLNYIPFEIKRIFWTYYTPESIVRGRHAHYKTEQILLAVAGRIIVTTEIPCGTIQTFVLEQPNQGLYIPPNSWHTMQYSHSAVQLVFASSSYEESDYIREYSKYKEVWKTL